MNNLLKYTLTTALVAATVGAFGVLPAAAATCTNEIIIYAQDYPGITSGDVAFVKNASGQTLISLSQIGDNFVIWPENILVPVSAGDVLRYTGTGGSALLTINILNTSGGVITTLQYGTETAEYTVPQNGYVRFPENQKAEEYNYLALCKSGGTSPQNHAPVWNQTAAKSVTAGQTLTFAVSATDTDNDTLTYSALFIPSGATFNPSTRVFAWTPTQNQIGSFSAVFRVTDGELFTDMTVPITVTSVPSQNHPPIWSQTPSQSVQTGQLLQFTVFASDPDNDFLTYSAVSLPSGASFNASSRVFSWVPSSSQTGTHTVTFRASDGKSFADMTVFITVFPGTQPPPPSGNHPPVWNQIPNQTVEANNQIQFAVSATDADNDTLTYSAANLPAGASFNTFTRIFSWIPYEFQKGTHPITFTVTDGTAAVDMTVVITVTVPGGGGSGTNHPPIWSQTPSQSVQTGQLLQFTVFASDPDNDFLTYSAVSLPSGASFNASSRVFSWVPSSSQTGTHTTVFRVSDGFSSVNMSVTITVTGGGGGSGFNQPPVWSQVPNQSVQVNQLLQLSVFANDANNDFLTYSAVSLPSGASFNASSRVFSWVPSSSQTGTHTVTLRVSDGFTSVDTSFSVTVSNDSGGNFFNQSPQWIQTPSQSVQVNQLLQFSVFATDPNGDFLTYSTISLPSGASFNTSNRTFSWVPNANQIGSHTASFRVSDGTFSSSMSVFISVTETFTQGSSGIPEFINFNPPLVAHEGQLYNYAVQAISNNLNTVTYSVPVGPAGLSIHSTTGLISWTPTFSQGRVTPYQVTVQASNGAHTASRTYFIAVLESTATQPPTVIVTPPTVIVSPPVTVTPPAAPLPLTIDDIEIHTERNGDVIVTWETNREALGRVIYGETSQTDRTENYTYDEATPDAGPAIRHEANLGDLDENTTYYLRAVAKTNDRMTVSPEIAFVKSARGLGLASATFAGLSLFSWFLILAIIALAILLFMAYRKRQMTDPK